MQLNKIMAKFALKSITAVKGKQQFKQLVIVDDNVDINRLQQELDNGKTDIDGVLDIYEMGLEHRYQSSFRGIIAIMNRFADLQSISDQKFRNITPKGDLVKEYEFKYQDLRVYAIKMVNGPLVLLGGYKNTQSSDMTKFRSLKKQFLENER